MFRLLGWLAFAILGLILLTVIVALSKADFGASIDKPYLFSLPDLSSPRATLQTLIDNGSVLQKAIFTKGVPWVVPPEVQRMMDTVNVSELPASRRELQSALAAALLGDVLENIPLPPLSEIPDAAAVRQNNLTEWPL